MLFGFENWLDQRQTIRRQKETIECLKATLMAQPEIVRHKGILFLRKDGGWMMYQEVGFTPENKLWDKHS